MSIKYGERWAQGLILQWINQVIKEQKLSFKRADQEVQVKTIHGKVKYPDIVIWDESGEKVACLIELKAPTISPYDEELVEDALNKSVVAGIPFFVTWNVNKLVLWETFKPGTNLLERRLHHEDVLDIKDLKDLEKDEIEKTIRSFLERFLQRLQTYYEIKVAKSPEIYVLPKLPPDEILVHYLKTFVDSLYIPVSNNLIKKKKDPKFYEDLVRWFVSQGWLFEDTEDDYDRVARQAIYLLVNKILFYNILKERFGLKEIDAGNISSGEELKKKLQEYFNHCLNINPRYGIIFAADFLERIPLPDEIVSGFTRVITELNKYDFSKIGYDIIGRIFEKLIPKTERHKLGQYFTSTDVVDLILGFTIKHPDDKVLDPACGSGTFLIRAYHRKRFLAQKLFKEGKYAKPFKSHEELVRELWGIDIAKFPAHLALINIVRENIKAIETIPNIACKDFFEVLPGKETLMYELAFQIPGVKEKELEAVYSEDFNSVVTNPPYTRQEEMEDVFLGGYKDRLRELIKKTWGMEVSKRSSIYVYFFLHGTKLLAKNGRLGLITSNSWLDVDFGKYLQEFFLKNFKVIAIIESKVERWFEDADINTAITILEKCDDKKVRDSNLVKFVYLKRKLREIIQVGENEEERWNNVERFVDFVENCDKDEKIRSQTKKIDFLGKILWIYEDENFRITMISQADLWAEGWNEEENKFDGSKWGKYIRAPKIFFKILEIGKNLFIPLGKEAIIIGGIITGSNEFFYLTKDKIGKWGIEARFLVPVVKTPKELTKIAFTKKDLRYMLFYVKENKEKLVGTNALKYILAGEERNLHKRPTLRTHELWYQISELKTAPLLWVDLRWDKHICHINIDNVPFEHTFYGIRSKNSKDELLCAFLNSTLTWLFIEVLGRTGLGGGAIRLVGTDLRKFPIASLDKLSENNFVCEKLINIFRKLKDRDIGTVFEEIGAYALEEVSLDNVKKDRREIDKILISEILGLSEQEQVEVYKAVIDLVKTRIEKARIFVKRKKKKDVDVEALANNILSRLTAKIEKFPDVYLSDYKGLWSKEIKIPKGQPTFGSDINGFYVQVEGKEVYRGWDHDEAKFIYFAALTGASSVKLPLDKNALITALEAFEKDYRKLKEEVDTLLSTMISDVKVRKEVEDKVWSLLFSRQAV